MLHLPKLLSEFQHSADWVGLHWSSEKTTHYRIVNECLDSSSTHFDQGLRIEVLVDGHFGYAGTTDFSSVGLRTAFQRALDLTRSSSKHGLFNFSKDQRPSSRGQYRSPVQKSLDSLGIESVVGILRECSQAMKISEKIVTRSAMATIIETQIQTANTSGAETTQDFSMVNLSFTATAVDGQQSQVRSQNGPHSLGYQVGAEIISRHRLLDNCELLAEQALELLKAPDLANETMDLVLAPDQMMLQIHESVGHPLELDRILGDERNYAGWSFVNREDFGTLQYGSSLMNIVFDPTRYGELASYAFDDSGLKANREYLIRDGILVRGLGGLESQIRSGLPGVACFRSSSWNRPPIDRMANINLVPGTTPLNDMIASIQRGVLMQANRSFSIDDYRHKFQFACEYGQLIEDGKLTSIVKNPCYRGMTVPFWRKLTQLSREEETYGTGWCGKGEPNQVIRVGHASPYAHFKDIEVFGGAQSGGTP